MSGEVNKQVRVDNWGVFFLQRLQMFFSKTDYCDLTLQFEGNVQLKVHRLVMNACTEYFDFLEKSCPALEENVILMPSNLQADVIVPIVNFIYTGMLEFHVSMFERLYKAADLMSISVLTKLLDAQKTSMKKKPISWLSQEKKVAPKVIQPKELPLTLPGRKLPVWKRKVVPVGSGSPFSDRWSNSSSQDHQTSISSVDNTPKPTRFEWPDEDLPSLSLMDTSVEEISFTSRPLVTQNDELQPSTSFDFLRNSSNTSTSFKKQQQTQQEPATPPVLDIDEIKDYIKEQKIRTELVAFEEDDVEPKHEEPSNGESTSQTTKRKLEHAGKVTSPKRSRITDNNKETTISITTPKGSTDLDHNKIVADILKKYPHLMKNNKNIRLKIIAAGGGAGGGSGAGGPPGAGSSTNHKTNSDSCGKKGIGTQNNVLDIGKRGKLERKTEKRDGAGRGESVSDTWVCNICLDSGEHMEYRMFYMYKKHMMEVHNQQFEENLCKCCGLKCSKDNVMMYHMLTKHGIKAPKGVTFPTCSHCPYVAISPASLSRHVLCHDKNEIQCSSCHLAFASSISFTRHMQITGHGNHEEPAKKDVFDCQFCTKKYNSASNLFAHVKDNHALEAKRDGVVIIDVEDENFEDDEDDLDQVEENLLEDFAVSSKNNQQDKVNIISNLKVDSSPHATHLEPSSEAEALSNVASGIATSLGLVDIVVLDENQQYILQQATQQQQQQQQHQQSEAGSQFILPHLDSSGVHQQGDISATDELVMVLTDHDYQDGQDATNVDNSNIVVLYSHPVEGQQGQFITSQANLMVNSEMGLLEIRNGPSTVTTTAQIMPTNDGPIESIETIQREIESYSKETTNYFQQVQEPPPTAINTDTTDIGDQTDSAAIHFATAEPMDVDESENQQPQPTEQQFSSQPVDVNQTEEPLQEPPIKEETSENNETTKEEHDITTDIIQDKPETEEQFQELAQQIQESVPENATDVVGATECEQYVPPEPMEVDGKIQLQQNHVEPLIDANQTSDDMSQNDHGTPEVPIENEQDHQQNESEDVVDAPVIEHQTESTENNIEGKENEINQVESNNVVDESEADSDKKANNEEHEDEENEAKIHSEAVEQISQSATELQIENEQSETSNSQFAVDDNSQSWQENQNVKTKEEEEKPEEKSPLVKSSILEDWEDTDSQQSEKQKEMMKDAEERVNKLMDDWDEEDEEDGDSKRLVSNPPSADELVASDNI